MISAKKYGKTIEWERSLQENERYQGNISCKDGLNKGQKCYGPNRSRDITLPTKICLVKAMVFPVVMYGCESWTIKKGECQRIDAFELWCGKDS